LTLRRAALLAPSLLALALYLPTWRHEFVFDDRGVILENPLMRDIASLPRLLGTPYWNAPGIHGGLYRPLTSISFALDRAVAGGFDPRYYHAVNILLHAAVTALVTALALQLLGSAGGACVAGLLFAAHPVHVEAVAGIVGRSELLAGGFVLAALLSQRAALRGAGPRSRLWMLCAPTAAFLAMLAKESAFVAPALGVLIEWASPSGAGARRKRAVLGGGYALALVAALVARSLVLGSPGPGPSIPFVDNPAASAGALAGRLTALACVTRYARLLLWPHPLSADYSYHQIPVTGTASDPLVLAGGTIVLILLAGGLMMRRRWPAAGFALLWIAVSALPGSNLVVFIGTLLGERLLYLPSVGLCLLAGALYARAGSARREAPVGAAALSIVGVLAGVTAWRIPDWRDDFTLYRSAAVVSPLSTRIRYNLGNAYLRQNQFAQAETEYRQALAIYGDFHDARANLGMAILQQGRPAEALPILREASDGMPRNADLVVNVGSAYRALGDPARAEEEFRRALAIDPGSAKAWNNLGSLALARGDAAAAEQAMRHAVAADPAYALFHINLADALAAAGRKEEAFDEFRRAARLEPDLPEARRGLGEIALDAGDRAAAELQFRAALEGNPPSARAANFLGYLETLRGQPRAAEGFYERALELDPTLFDAHRSLGLLYAGRLGDPDRAAEHLRESLRLEPHQPGAEELRRILADLKR
jgi:tetratricopeptide (TPR) repeat protein